LVKEKLPEDIDSLVAKLAGYSHGGWIFAEYFDEGLEAPWEEFEEELREAVEHLVEDGEVESAREMAKLLEAQKYADALKIYFKYNPSCGEWAGFFTGCLVRAGRYDDAKELLKFIAEITDWFDT